MSKREIIQPTGKENIDYLMVLTAAEKAVKFFSKIRLSIDQPLDNGTPERELKSWCPPRFFSLLKVEVPYQRSNTRPIPCYRLAYDKAETLESPETLLDYIPFVILKNYFAAKRFRIVLRSKIPVTLIYAHDPDKLEKFSGIDLRSTKEMIRQLSTEIQGFWSLEYLKGQQVKIPAFYGQFLLEGDLIHKIRPIQLHPRNYIMGDKSGVPAKTFAPRYYILNKDKEIFDRIAQRTIENLSSLVKDRQFFSKCKKGHSQFKQLK